MARRDRHLTRAVRRLRYDPRLRAGFRADPEGTLATLGVAADHTPAIQAGDAASLTAAGIDVRRLESPPLALRLRARLALLLTAVAGLVVAAPSPAGAARRLVSARRFGARFVRADARRLRLQPGERFGLRFARAVRFDVRLRLLPGCDLKCVDLEVLD
jgi:hypothetical protein